MKRPTSLLTESHEVQVGCGTLYVTISQTHEKYREIYAQLGKTGGCARCFTEVISTLVTEALNNRTPLEKVIHQFEGVRCPSDSGFLPSCPVAMGKIMEKVWGDPKEQDA